jgi:competence ComEA-like helix-hairpin-helix protein
MKRARPLLCVLLVGLALCFSVRALRPPGKIGPAAPAPPCAIPIERRGRGVACVGRDSGLVAGDVEGGGRMAPDRLAAWAAPVEINRASVAELASLDGIGPKLGARIVAARPFRSVEELAKVRGIGRRRLARLRPRLFLDERAPNGVR